MGVAGSELRAEALDALAEQDTVAAVSDVQQDGRSQSQIARGQNDNRVARDSRIRTFQLPCSAIGAVFAGVDSAAILLSSLAGAIGYQLLASASWSPHFQLGAGAAAALLYFLIGRSSGFYQAPEMFSSGRRDASDVLQHWLLTSLLLTLLAFLFRIGVEFSRGAIICFFVVALGSLLASRSAMRAALAWAVKSGRLQGRRVIVVGPRDELAAVDPGELLRRFGLTEVERVALPELGNWSLSVSRRILAALDDALRVARDRGAEEIVLALSWNDTRSIELIRDRLRSSPLPVQLLPDQKVRYLTTNPAFSVNRSFSIGVQRTPLSDLEQFTKRVLDMVGAAVLLLGLLPLMLVTALAIKIDSPGPVLFRQRRSGFNAKRFMIFKFRTMTVMEDGDKVSQATKHDPRVTPFGGFLRASSIDELPQLINVLRGDMSLVGPRPHALAHDDQYSEVLADYAYRHHVKPGITGWAQVHGYRGATAQVELMKRRLEFDLWYISNWHLGLDFMILLRTMFEVFRRRNAY
jgi:undecaprenyl-phosphate galactose phosphotransferase/putative colanic acid biosynthesis UDP-glucose lipid carrier transferase